MWGRPNGPRSPRTDMMPLYGLTAGAGHIVSALIGEAWQVRRIVDESRHPDGHKNQVIYKVVAGKDVRASGVMTREDFARWARYEVVRHGKGWRRVD